MRPYAQEGCSYLIFFIIDNLTTFIGAAMGAGMMGLNLLAAIRAGGHGGHCHFLMGTPFVPF
jgi:hypothetical protein